MKPWHEKIVDAHLAVTDAVSHGERMKSERYFVWQEDGADDLVADNRHVEQAMTGTTDLFTKMEFDPWKNALESAFNESSCITWKLNGVQFEKDTGFWHYEWIWSVA